jgi:hypothetical protein
MVPEDLFGPIKAEDNMTQEWWWSAHGVLLRKFSSQSEANAALSEEKNPVIFVTGEGWNIEVNKYEISVVSRAIKSLN